MIFRLRRYQVVPGKLEAFTELFAARLLPIQRRHGARLVGRWASEDERFVVALWAYDDREAYEAIQARVHADPESAAAREHRRALEPLFTDVTEELLVSTVPLSVTELAHLDELPA